MMNNDVGKSLIIIGLVIVILGIILNVLPKGGSFPKLPGDIYIKRGNFTFYFPWVTSIIISIVLTLIFYLIKRR